MSKCDAIDKETLEERAEALKKAAKKKPLILSAVSGEGMREALFALGKRDRPRQEAGKSRDRSAEGLAALSALERRRLHTVVPFGAARGALLTKRSPRPHAISAKLLLVQRRTPKVSPLIEVAGPVDP